MTKLGQVPSGVNLFRVEQCVLPVDTCASLRGNLKKKVTTRTLVFLLVLFWFSPRCCAAEYFTLELWNQLSAVSWVKDSLNTPYSATSGAARHAQNQPESLSRF